MHPTRAGGSGDCVAMEAKYLELAREIWAEMTPEQRTEALKPVDWLTELARMEREALQELREELNKLPERTPYDVYIYGQGFYMPIAPVSSAPAVPVGA